MYRNSNSPPLGRESSTTASFGASSLGASLGACTFLTRIFASSMCGSVASNHLMFCLLRRLRCIFAWHIVCGRMKDKQERNHGMGQGHISLVDHNSASEHVEWLKILKVFADRRMVNDFNYWAESQFDPSWQLSREQASVICPHLGKLSFQLVPAGSSFFSAVAATASCKRVHG